MSPGAWDRLDEDSDSSPGFGDRPGQDGPSSTDESISPAPSRVETGEHSLDSATPQVDIASELARSAFKAMAFGGSRRYPRVGRYRVLDTLGEGGMGVVFRAHDDELARPVALKLLQVRGHGPRREAANARMLREARAMAQLSHPNVVQIYDVGEFRGQVFLAMELIQGQTLDQWIRELGPPAARRTRLDELLAHFVAAGRGLAAAHAAGLVHRDFKPANVIIGDDGGVRVLDFGLAQGPFAELAASVAGLGEPSRLSELSERAMLDPMTRTGAVLGTPAYMSPEQLRAGAASEASDQFSLCVALFEALVGVRPYMGNSLTELAAKFDRGEREPIPRDLTIPAWILAALDRGLEIEAEARWPSMDALLDALLDDPRRRRRWQLATGAALALGLGLGASWWAAERQAVAACEAAGDAVSSGWTSSERARLRDTFVATEAAGARQSWERVEHRVDAWTGEWRDARTRACLEQREHPEPAKQHIECLEQQRWQLESLLELFASADAPLTHHAVATVAALPPVQRCREPGWLAASRQSASLDETLRRELVEIATLERAGRYEPALSLAERTYASARARGDAAVQAEAARRLGAMQRQTGDFDRARENLRAAYFEAGALGHDRVALEAAELLALLHGWDLGEVEAARDWVEHLRMRVRHMGLDPERERPELTTILGYLHRRAGEHREALAAYERAYASMRAQLDPDHPELAVALTNLGVAHHELGDYARALEHFERALAHSERSLGPAHPDAANILVYMGRALERLERYDEALAAQREALARLEAALGPEHPDVAQILSSLADTLRQRGAFIEAEGLLERALPILERSYGREDLRVAKALGTLASIAARLDQPRRAIELLERALELKLATLGPEHDSVAITLAKLGMRYQELGELDEALDHFTRAVEIDERTLGPAHPDLAADLDSVGAVLFARGDREAALAYYRRAQAMRAETLPADHGDHAASLDLIGELLRTRGELEAAIEHHRRALALREGAYGREHWRCAISSTQLGLALAAAGRRDEALAALERALTLLEASEGEFPIRRALALEGLAALREAQGEAGAALELQARAVDLRRAHPGDPAARAQAEARLAAMRSAVEGK